MSSMKQFGMEVAKAQDEIIIDDGLLSEVRKQFLEKVTVEPRKRGTLRWKIGFSIAASLALMTLGYLAYLSQETFTIEVGDSRRVLPTGHWVSAPRESSLPLTFYDGSLVVLKPLSRAKVSKLDSKETRMSLESGTAEVAVVQKPGSKWILFVGPYEVDVVGTRFAVSWDPEYLRFSLGLEKGSVVVTGPMFDEGIKVENGQALIAWVRENRYEILPSRNRVSELAEISESKLLKVDTFEDTGKSERNIEVFDKREPYETEQTVIDVAEESTETRLTKWSNWARKGLYAEAMEAVKEQGIDRIIADCGAKDLLLLGDTARLNNEWDIAERVYRSIRRRYLGTKHSGRAAFALGKMAFDQHKRYDEAARWLGIYLDEQGATPLAREALGRLVESLDKSGDEDGAKEAAQKYLAAYPDGPHALLVEKLAEVDDSSIEGH